MEKSPSISQGLNVIMYVKAFCKLLNATKMQDDITVIKICHGLHIMVRIPRNSILEIISLELAERPMGTRHHSGALSAESLLHTCVCK